MIWPRVMQMEIVAAICYVCTVICFPSPAETVASPGFVARRGAKLEIRSWGTHGRLQGPVQQLLDDYSFVTKAVLIERAVSC